MSSFTNQGNVPLSLAVFLATDNYDGKEPGTISATSLLKPIRQIALAHRVPEADSSIDILSLVKSRMGTAIHDSIEKSWLDNYKTAMKALGYPQRVIDKVRVNPNTKEDLSDCIPVYLEIRSYKEVDGVTISGKFDFLADGRIEDFKSTSVATWINNNKDEDYIAQGSIYRWLNPDIVTQDTMAINFIFWDWQPGRAKADPTYPPKPVVQKTFSLWGISETERFITNKIRQINRYWNAPQESLPACTDKELWRKETQWKYYKNPNKTHRSTKNFSDKIDAYNRLAQDKHVGIVKEVPGEVVACKYCPAFAICTQKDELIAAGDLKL